MIASRLGLAVLTAIAVALALMLVLVPPRAGVARSRQLVPAEVAERARRVVLRRLGAKADPVIELVRADGGWQVAAPAPGPADAAAVADLLSALSVARWDRAVPIDEARGSGLDAPRLIVELGGPGEGATQVAIGAAVPGTAQVWARVGRGEGLLAPAWVASALDRDLGALRQRRLAPVAPGQITGVEVHGPGGGVVLAGRPLQIRGDGWSALAAPEPVRGLVEAIAALVAVGFPRPDERAVPAAEMSIRLVGGAATVDLASEGRCADRTVRVEGSAGTVCVAEAAWSDVARRAASASTEPARWIDPRPIDAATVAELTWRRTGVTLRRSGAASTLATAAGERAADEDAVQVALAALAAPAVRVVAAPPGDGEVVLEVRRADGGVSTLSFVRTPDGPALRRDREPFALLLATPALAALGRGEGDLRDRSLVAEEPTALARLAIRSGGREIVAARGAAVGEWTAPAGVDVSAVAAAVPVLAALRAERFVPAAMLGPVRVVLDATFDPPPVDGAAAPHHVVEIGAARADGTCVARVGGTVAQLAAEACRILGRLASVGAERGSPGAGR